MTVGKADVTFHVALLKQSKPGKAGMEVVFKGYEPDKRLCVFSVLLHYIEMTKQIRDNEQQLFISYRKPHGKVSKATIAGWIKRTMNSAGIDTVFKPHSTRAAASSAAKRKQVPLPEILAAAGWSSEKTFQMYYNKPLEKQNSSFANAVLE